MSGIKCTVAILKPGELYTRRQLLLQANFSSNCYISLQCNSFCDLLKNDVLLTIEIEMKKKGLTRPEQLDDC